MEFGKELKAERTCIPGMLVLDLPVHGDSRGWFKENWHRAKMGSLGLSDFGPVQNNVSFNAERGVTRGIHAEPWDKYISVAAGSVFGAWVDLRHGESFGKLFTCVVDSSKAVFVPRGVGNSFQALEDGTVYTYLVNAHWSPELKETYTFVNLADPELGINWPVPLDECELSEADKSHPMLKDAAPMAPKRALIMGNSARIGRALRKLVEERGLTRVFDFVDRADFDIADPFSYGKIDWPLYDVVVNCADYTATGEAETSENRVAVWKANAVGPALLARACTTHNITLAHIDSECIFDGAREVYGEEGSCDLLGFYGQSKAAGALAVSVCPRHYIVRRPRDAGSGRVFTEARPEFDDCRTDSIGFFDEVDAVTDEADCFADDAAVAILHLLDTRAPYGTYDLTVSLKAGVR